MASVAGMTIQRGPSGHRVGQCHQRARLTDAQVRQMRALHEQHGWGYKRLAKHFGCGESTARDICTYSTSISA